MIRVKTFATPIRIFETMHELHELDEQVAAFLAAERAATVLSMSDTATTGEPGGTIGLIRSVVYEVDDD